VFVKTTNMNSNDLITKNDLQDAENRIIQHLTELIKNLQPSKDDEFLRTKQARAFLKISDNKLVDMRNKREIPYTYIGATYFYPKAPLLEILKQNMVLRNPNV
jgi:hypothetical protein